MPRPDIDALIRINAGGDFWYSRNEVLRHTVRKDFGPINTANLRRAYAHQEGAKTIGKSVLIGF